MRQWYLLFACVWLPLVANAAPLEIAYGAHEKQRMDVYGAGTLTHAPIVVMVHGGAWRIGDKSMGRVVDAKQPYFNGKDYVFISLNYRLLPEADPLQQAADVAAALRYIRANASQWGGDASRLILMGHSAGAHLVALLGANPAAWGLQPWTATIGLDSAVYDVASIMRLPHLPLYDKAFGTDASFWVKASPRAQLSMQAVPMLLVCSSERRVSCAQAKLMAKQAIEFGAIAEVLTEEKSHGEINAELGTPGDYTASVQSFIDRRLGQ